jgi:anti-sigma factor RsiW
MTSNHENLLWDYADDLLSPSERTQVEALLANDPTLKQGLEHILLEKNTFSSLPLEHTPISFASNVMAAWQQEQGVATVYVPQPNWIIRSIAAIFTLLLVASLMVIGWATPSLPSISLPKIPITLLSSLEAGTRLVQPLILLLLGGLTASFVEKWWSFYGQTSKFA